MPLQKSRQHGNVRTPERAVSPSWSKASTISVCVSVFPRPLMIALPTFSRASTSAGAPTPYAMSGTQNHQRHSWRSTSTLPLRPGLRGTLRRKKRRTTPSNGAHSAEKTKETCAAWNASFRPLFQAAQDVLGDLKIARFCRTPNVKSPCISSDHGV